MSDAPHRAQLAGTTRIWAKVFGGHADIAGTTSGAAGLGASNYGFAAGGEISATGSLLLGASLGVGRQDFSAGAGSGSSDDVMLGGYARQAVGGRGYLSAGIGYGWHAISGRRTVTVSGTDVLGAKYDAHDLGWRVEGGWAIPTGSVSLTPFAAIAGDRFESPAYAETALSGSNTFALSYAASSVSQAQSELGARIGGALSADMAASLHAGWAHQLNDAPLIAASFQSLAGSRFQLRGVRAANDTALLGLDLDWRQAGGFGGGIQLNSQLGQGTTIFEGMGTVGWRW